MIRDKNKYKQIIWTEITKIDHMNTDNKIDNTDSDTKIDNMDSDNEEG